MISSRLLVDGDVELGQVLVVKDRAAVWQGETVQLLAHRYGSRQQKSIAPRGRALAQP
jgi:hypothetical protein